MGLELILGPANAGKVADLYARYLAALDAGHEALLVVPGRPAVVRAERDLLRAPARRPGQPGRHVRRRLPPRGRAGRATAGACCRRGTRTALLRRLANDRAGVPADALPGADRPARLGARRSRRARRERPRARSPTRTPPGGASSTASGPSTSRACGSRPAGCSRARSRRWDGALLFVEGFEDLSVAQEALVRLVGARSGATMTLPYEPGRPAFAALAELVGAARRRARHDARRSARPPRVGRAPALAAWERRLFQDAPSSAAARATPTCWCWRPRARAPRPSSCVDAVLRALRSGVAPGEILIVTPHDPVASEIGDALRGCGVPLHVEGRRPLPGDAARRRARLAAAGGLGRRAGARRPVRVPALALVGPRAPARRPGRGARARARHQRRRGHRGGGVGEPRRPARRARAAARHRRRAGGRDRDGARDARVRARAQRRRRRTSSWSRDVAAASAALEALDALRDPALDPPPGREEVRAALGAGDRARRPRPGRARAAPGRPARRAGCRPRSWSWPGLEDAGLRRRPARRSPGLEGVLPAPDAPDLARHRVYTAVTRARARVVLVARRADDDGRELPPSHHVDDLVRALGSDAAAPQPRARRPDVGGRGRADAARAGPGRRPRWCRRPRTAPAASPTPPA